MSLFAVKYLRNHGWVGAKNFSFTFKPTLLLKKSFRDGLERLYVWESTTKYTEGLNNKGICIFSSNIQTKQDPKEAKRFLEKSIENNTTPRKYYDPNGIKIRSALSSFGVDEAINVLIERQITGCSVVFDSHKCVVLEAGHVEGDSREEYTFSTKEISPNFPEVRSTNGIILPWLGDESDRNTSNTRQSNVLSKLTLAETPKMVLGSISDNDTIDIDGKRKTAYQVLLCPYTKKMCIRTLWCGISVNYNRINSLGGDLSFEIDCTQRLSFSDMNN